MQASFPFSWGYHGVGSSENLYINGQFLAYVEGTSDNLITARNLDIQFVLLRVQDNFTPKNRYFKVLKVKYLFSIPSKSELAKMTFFFFCCYCYLSTVKRIQ